MNYSTLTDFYELTMSNGYYLVGKKDEICYFDIFYRSNPDQGGYSVFCGLASIIDYIKNLHFTKEDIEYLRSKNTFDEGFLEYLANYQFHGDIYSVEEGTVIFPYEPLIIVRATSIEAQILETFLLICVNHQSLIATKARRIIQASDGRPVLELGARRAHGASSALLGARASYISGVVGTATTQSDILYHVPAVGTMAHSWVQMFDSEYEAFLAYAKIYPHNITLLIDTYDVLNSGIPNTIKVVKEVLWPQGIKKCAVRIDSGDIAYLTKKARKLLDDAGLVDCKICVSNSLDEYIISDLIQQGACIDSFGVGENLVTAKSDAVFGGVYKLGAVEKNGVIEPKIKISENIVKITNPGYKKVYRLFDKTTKKAIADYIALAEEKVPLDSLVLFDEREPWKQKEVSNYDLESLLKPIYIKGKLVYKEPDLESIRKHALDSYNSLWDEVKRFRNPASYYVDLSQKLYGLKYKMLHDYRKGVSQK